MKKQLLYTFIFFFSFYLGHSKSAEESVNPLCPTPVLTAVNGSSYSMIVSWTETGSATSWNVLVLPCVAPPPNVNATDWVPASSNPYVVNGLSPNTCYTVYVRSSCGANGVSDWSNSINFTTDVTPPVCGGMFVDTGGAASNYTNNENQTFTICPTVPGDAVSVTFTSFDVESNNDALYIYNGITPIYPLIPSTNGAGNVPGGLAGGYWGNTLPGTFTSTTPNGCLTFVFRSNSTITSSGWVANISCSPQVTIGLFAFIDTNNNGIQDTGEIPFTDGSFVYDLNNSGVNNYVTSLDGHYFIQDQNTSNSYDFSYVINSQLAPYLSTTTSYNNISPNLTGGLALYFPIAITAPFNDASVAVIPFGQPRPGFAYYNAITYKNTGTLPTSGTVTFTKDPQVNFSYVSPSTTVPTATGFTYNYSNLGPNQEGYILIAMIVPPIPTVNIGAILTNSASIVSTANDVNPSNNSFSNSQVVIGSYDPNDKMESHGPQIQFNQFTANDYLYYTVRFQNEGTADALTVRIEDVLDAQIDPTSIRMIAASHPYLMRRTNNHLVWTFDNINLPPTSVNEAASKGYVMFKVKLNPGFAVGSVVPNTANIYFDTNPAVITNTFNTQFVALNTAEFDSGNFVISPNPATNNVEIQLQNTAETIERISITDVLGKTIRSINTVSNNQVQIDVSDFSKGIYFVEITTASHLKQVKKLVIE